MGSNLNLWKNKQIVLKFDLHGLVETRLHTFLEFTFAHIYHLCTKKYYACSHLEINVCAHSLLKTSLFVSLLLMYIIFSSSWLENTSYWSSASLVFYLDFGNFCWVFSPSPVYALSDRFNNTWQKICCVLLRNFCHNNLVWSFSWFNRGLTFGLLMNFMSLNPSLIWLRMVMLAWPSNTIKSLRSVVHVALHSF